MRICRIKYSVLGLLVYYLQCVFTWSCGSEFEDVASKTVMADLVFEGVSVRKVAIKNKPGFYYYNFKVISLIKGNFSNQYLQSLEHLSKETTSTTIPSRRSNGLHSPDASRNHDNTWNHNRIRNDYSLHSNNKRHDLSHYSHDTYTNRRNHYGQSSYYRAKRRGIRAANSLYLRNVRNTKPKPKRRSRIVMVKQFGPSEDVSECIGSIHQMKHKKKYLVFLRLSRRASTSPSEITTRRQSTTQHFQHRAYGAKRSNLNRSYNSNSRQRSRYRRSLDRNRTNSRINIKKKYTNKEKNKNRKKTKKKYSMSSMPVLSKDNVKTIARNHRCFNCSKFTFSHFN